MASQAEIYSTLLSVGANPQEAQILSAIAMAESGGNADVWNDTPGETSGGWYQINMDVHRGVNPNDPVDSSRYALNLFRARGGQPWSVTHEANGRPYLKFMNTPLQPVALPRTGGNPMQENDPFNPNGGTGTGTTTEPKPPEKLQVGQGLVVGDQVMNVVYVGNDRVLVAPPGATWNAVTGAEGAVPLPSGTYQIPGQNATLNVTSDGKIINEAAPDNSGGPISGELIPTGIPGVSINPNTGAVVDLRDSGGSFAPHYPTPYGFAAPDPASAVSAIFQKYEYELMSAQLPREQAKENFEQRMRLFEAVQSGEISYGQFLQNAAITEAELTSARDNQLIEIAKAQQTDERERSLARTNRDLEIGNIRQQAGTDWLVHGAPKALPSNVTGIQLPILGNIGTTQYNPDDVMGIPYLNSIRDVPDSNVSFPTPSAVPQIPVPDVSKPPAELGVPFPTFNVPNIPDISGLIAQLTGGSPPMGFA